MSTEATGEAIILDGAHSLLLVRQPATAQRHIAARLAEMKLLADSTASGN